MTRRLSCLVTGIAALVLLTAAVVGLPVILYRFGGLPLPRHLAGWHRVISALAGRDGGVQLLGIVRDVSWLAWLSFSISVLVEAQAAARRRVAPRLRLGAMQGGAARLVALAALTFSVAPSATLTASAAVVTAAHLALSAPADRVIIVRPGDCLWAIAQRYLGAGDRYPEIASMNYGRDMGSGQVFTNPAFIEPGWRLLLPASGQSVGGHDPVRTAALRHLGHPTHDGHYRRQHPAAGLRSHTAPDAGAASGPVAAGPSTRDTALPLAPAGLTASGGDHVPEPLVFGAGLLAGAVLTSLTRMRWRQRQYRGRGRRIPLPPEPEALAVEQRLRAVAEQQPTIAAPGGPPTTLHDALCWLEAGMGEPGQVLPDIVGLHVTPGRLEVLLAVPAAQPPPPPFLLSPGRQGMCWHLDFPVATGASTPVPAAQGTSVLPGLFTVGATGDGYLLLDLESLQVTGCDGPPELTDRVVVAAGTELATGQWSGWYDLILVGFDDLEPLGRAEHLPSLDAALCLLEDRCAAVSHRLAGETADIRQLRLNAPDDEDWGLTVVVSRAEPSPAEMAHLLDLVEDGPGGIAVLVAGDPEADDGRMAPTVLQLAPDPQQPGVIVANIVPLQISVRPRSLSAAEYQAIATLFATAADTRDVSQEQAPYDLYAAPPWIPQAAAMQPSGATADWQEDDPSSEGHASGQGHASGGPPLAVTILGPFAITGAPQPLQPKQAELVLALALAAPGGLANSALRTILGADPDHPKPPDVVRQVITRTRRRLGRASDGREFVIHTGNGNYMLHPDVSLDWTEFRRLVADGRSEDLRAALALVRGQPFAGSYYWWIDIPLVETVRAEIIDVAETLAEFELSAGSPRAAARAARAGLAADASAEQLWRLLMRTEHAAGNLAGVAEAWRRCLQAIEDVAPGGEPHPDTEALYRQLTATRQQAPVRS